MRDNTIYRVVVNDEEQYSVWPADRENPFGWRSVGKTGTKEECLAYIREVWTDMRPLSLRLEMEEAASQELQTESYENDAASYPPWDDTPTDRREEVQPTVPSASVPRAVGQQSVMNFVKCPYCGLNNAPDDVRCERCKMELKLPSASSIESEQTYQPARKFEQESLPANESLYDSFDSLGEFLTEALEADKPYTATPASHEQSVAPSSTYESSGPARPHSAVEEEAKRGAGMQAFTGEVRMFAGSFAPRGWALCHGQLLLISMNRALFSVLGTTYGGDGQTTFALPDLRGRVPVGEGTTEPHEQSYNYLGQHTLGAEVYMAAQDGGRHALTPASLTLNFIICLEGLFPSRD